MTGHSLIREKQPRTAQYPSKALLGYLAVRFYLYT